MQDNKTINDFRKGYRYDQMAEDPTYLTFFFMFDYYSADSPLLNGEAASYLRNVLGDEERARHLENFIKILSRVNAEYPWFWQGVSGLETTRQYDKLQDPFWGNDKSIEVSCLETVELTVSGMLDLYKRAAYDFNRWVEVIPKNLRFFKMSIWVTDVRDFFYDTDVPRSSIVDVRPYFLTTLSQCQFDIESGNNIFSDLKRSPEQMTETSFKIFWRNVETSGAYANTLINMDRSIGEMLGDVSKSRNENEDSGIENEAPAIDLSNVYDAIANSEQGLNVDNIHDAIADAAEDLTVDNIHGEAAENSDELGTENVHGGATGSAGGTLDPPKPGKNFIGKVIDGAIERGKEALLAKLFLGNVHGLNLASSIQDAVRAGSVNGVANAIRNIANNAGGSGGSGDLGKAYDRSGGGETDLPSTNVYD